jgi:hypothetical protein
MANETERHTYTDWRPATTVGMVVLAILVLVLLVLLIAAANQQQPFLMAVIVVMFGLVAGAFAAVVQRLNAAHRRDLIEVIKAQAPHARASAPQVIDVPATRTSTRALPAPEMPTTIFDFDAQGQRVEIDPAIADRFIRSCSGQVSRERWTGANADYTAAVAYFSRTGALVKDGSGWRWADHITGDSLREWSLRARGMVSG